MSTGTTNWLYLTSDRPPPLNSCDETCMCELLNGGLAIAAPPPPIVDRSNLAQIYTSHACNVHSNLQDALNSQWESRMNVSLMIKRGREAGQARMSASSSHLLP